MASTALAAELVRRCFNARSLAHQFHLQTKSFSEHVALNEFYDAIPGLADSFAEGFQGKYGLLDKYPAGCPTYPNAEAMLSDLADWIDANRKQACSDSFLQNKIDEIVEQIYSTIYKLRYLK